MTEQTKGLPNKEAAKLQEFAQIMYSQLLIKAKEVIKVNIDEARKEYNIIADSEVSGRAQVGVMILDLNGDVVARATNSFDSIKYVNGASSTKEATAIPLFEALAKLGKLDLTDVDKKQVDTPNGKMSLKKLIHKLLGWSTNDELVFLREMYTKASPDRSGANPMDVLEERINQGVGVTDDDKKYVVRSSTKGLANPLRRNSAPLDTLIRMFKWSVDLCTTNKGILPQRIRTEILNALLFSPPRKDKPTMSHSFKMNFPNLGIIEKCGWYPEHGLMTLSTLAKIGNFYMGYYVEVPEIIKIEFVESIQDREEREKAGKKRETQQKQFLYASGEVILKLGDQLSLFT